jgi:hypothetical protein
MLWFSSRPAFNGKRAIGRVDHAFVNPEQLTVLSAVLDDHRESFCIERSSVDHQDASYLVMSLFEKVRKPLRNLRRP